MRAAMLALLALLGAGLAAPARAEVRIESNGDLTRITWTKATAADVIEEVAAKSGQAIEYHQTEESLPALTGSWEGRSLDDFIGQLLSGASRASYPSSGHRVTVVLSLHGMPGGGTVNDAASLPAAATADAIPPSEHFGARISGRVAAAQRIQDNRAATQTAMFLKSAGLNPEAVSGE